MGLFPRLPRTGFDRLFRRRRTMTELRFLAARQATLDALMEAHRCGDYATALDLSEGLRAGDGLTPEYCFYRGSLLMQLGREDEAEKWLRRRLALRSDDKRKALTHSVLGHLLMRQQRFDEAMECYDACLRLWPERASSHRNIAEAHLRRGGRPGDALEWARKAVAMERAVQPDSEGAQTVHHQNLSEQLATLAWAAAVSACGREEVDRLVAEAIALAGNQAAESTGLVHCQAGHAYAALGEAGMSERYFEEAARIDPQGRWGREACIAVASR